MQQVCSKKNLGPLNKKRAPLRQEVVGAPMERVVLDILRPLRETREGISTSMVVRDYLSKCMEAYPVPDHRNSSREVCQWVWLLIRSQRYCIQINFESQMFKEMCGILGINKTWSYHGSFKKVQMQSQGSPDSGARAPAGPRQMPSPHYQQTGNCSVFFFYLISLLTTMMIYYASTETPRSVQSSLSSHDSTCLQQTTCAAPPSPRGGRDVRGEAMGIMAYVGTCPDA